MADKKAGKKNRKWGKNKAFCLGYKNSNRREKNKLRRLFRHIKRYTENDVTAMASIQLCQNRIKGIKVA